jgi:hypothetical protein
MSPESSSVPPGRWLRAGVFSIAMTVLAATAHLVAGGHVPGTFSTVLAGLLVGCLTYPITRRDRGVYAILATTVAAQTVLHVAFAVSMAGPTSTRSGSGTGAAAHLGMPTGTSGLSVEQAWTTLRLDSPTPLMLATHAIAAVVLALGLRRSEQALLDLTAALRSFFGVLAAVATGRFQAFVVAANSRVRGEFDVVCATGTLVCGDHWGRAPPVPRAH